MNKIERKIPDRELLNDYQDFGGMDLDICIDFLRDRNKTRNISKL